MCCTSFFTHAMYHVSLLRDIVKSWKKSDSVSSPLKRYKMALKSAVVMLYEAQFGTENVLSIIEVGEPNVFHFDAVQERRIMGKNDEALLTSNSTRVAIVLCAWYNTFVAEPREKYP